MLDGGISFIEKTATYSYEIGRYSILPSLVAGFILGLGIFVIKSIETE